jgi:hypothetical protein
MIVWEFISPISFHDAWIGSHPVTKILVDTGSSVDVLYAPAFDKMGYERKHLRPSDSPLSGFTGNSIIPLGGYTPLPLKFVQSNEEVGLM